MLWNDSCDDPLTEADSVAVFKVRLKTHLFKDTFLKPHRLTLSDLSLYMSLYMSLHMSLYMSLYMSLHYVACIYVFISITVYFSVS